MDLKEFQMRRMMDKIQDIAKTNPEIIDILHNIFKEDKQCQTTSQTQATNQRKKQ